MTPIAAAVLVAAIAGPSVPLPPALDQIGPSELAEAVALGLSRDAARRAAFHEKYVHRVGGPVVQSLEVVTEFRRAVLLAEERARQGESAWATERAAAALAPYRGRLDVRLHLRFDPLNAYRTMPDATLVVYPRGAGGPGLRPASLQATPENYAGPVPPGTPILAATVEAAFPLSGLDLSRPVLVGVFLEGRELQRIPLDLSERR